MNEIAGWLVLVVYAGIVFTLVRPQSQGPKFVSALGTAVENILKAGMGA